MNTIAKIVNREPHPEAPNGSHCVAYILERDGNVAFAGRGVSWSSDPDTARELCEDALFEKFPEAKIITEETFESLVNGYAFE